MSKLCRQPVLYQSKERVCLGCDKKFKSKDGHRLCDGCNERNRGTYVGCYATIPTSRKLKRFLEEMEK